MILYLHIRKSWNSGLKKIDICFFIGLLRFTDKNRGTADCWLLKEVNETNQIIWTPISKLVYNLTKSKNAINRFSISDWKFFRKSKKNGPLQFSIARDIAPEDQLSKIVMFYYLRFSPMFDVDINRLWLRWIFIAVLLSSDHMPNRATLIWKALGIRFDE